MIKRLLTLILFLPFILKGQDQGGKVTSYPASGMLPGSPFTPSLHIGNGDTSGYFQIGSQKFHIPQKFPYDIIPKLIPFPIGSIININNFSGGIGLETNGGFSTSGVNLVCATDTTKYVRFPFATMLDQSSLTIDFKFTGTPSNGSPRLHYKSANTTVNTIGYFGYLRADGRLEIVNDFTGKAYLSTGTIPIISGRSYRLAFSDNTPSTALKVTDNVNGTNITLTLPGSLVIGSTVPGVTHNTAKVTVRGSTDACTIQYFDYSSLQLKNVAYLPVGDSKTHGYYAGMATYRWSIKLGYTPSAGSGDKTDEVANHLWEIENILTPQNVLLEIGINDYSVRNTAALMVNYKAIVRDLNAHNIGVVVVIPPPSNNVDMHALRDSLLLYYPTSSINMYDAMLGTGTGINPIYDSGDGTHIDSLGNALYAQKISQYFLYKNDYYNINITGQAREAVRAAGADIADNATKWVGQQADLSQYVNGNPLVGGNIGAIFGTEATTNFAKRISKEQLGGFVNIDAFNYLNGDSTITGNGHTAMFIREDNTGVMKKGSKAQVFDFLGVGGTTTATPNTLVRRDGSGNIFGTVTSLTTTGTSGPATLSAGVLNIPQYSGGGGGVTSVSSANGDISVATGTTTPVLTLNSGSGANQIVKRDVNSNVSAPAFFSTGTGGLGYFDLINQSTAPTGLSGHLQLYRNSTGNLSYRNGTLNRTYIVPKLVDVDITYPFKTSTKLADSTDVATSLATKQATLTLTTTGSGAATLTGATLNIPTPVSGNLTGDVTSVGLATTYNNVVPANKGGAGTVTGLLKANGSGTVSAAVSGTDYQVPLTFARGLSNVSNTVKLDTTGNYKIGKAGGNTWVISDTVKAPIFKALGSTPIFRWENTNGSFGRIQRDATANSLSFLNQALQAGGNGPALVFNGTTQYMSGAGTGLPTGTSIQLTAAKVFKTNAVGNTIILYGCDGNVSTGLSIVIYNGQAFAQNGNANVGSVALNNYYDNNPHLVVVTISGSTMTGYVDNVIASGGTTTLTSYNVSTNSNLDNYRYFAAGASQSRFFPGTIGQWLIYNVALTGQSVGGDLYNLYNSGGFQGSPRQTNLIRWFKFTEGSGSTVGDFNTIGTQYNLTTTNSPTWTSSGFIPGSATVTTSTFINSQDATFNGDNSMVSFGVTNSHTTVQGKHVDFLVNGNYVLASDNSGNILIDANRSNTAVPTGLAASLTLGAGTTTKASLNIPSGTLKTTAASGDVENNGTDLFYTTSTPTRQTIANLGATQTFTAKKLWNASIASDNIVNIQNTSSTGFGMYLQGGGSTNYALQVNDYTGALAFNVLGNGNTTIVGGLKLHVTPISATYTILSTDYYVDCTSGTFTVTLPTAVGITGQTYVVKNGGAGTITLATTSSQTIDGSTTVTITGNASVSVHSNGSNWLRN